MKTYAIVLASLVCAGIVLAAPAPAKQVIVRFSPKGGCTDLVVWHIDLAKTSLFVGSYQWSSEPIRDAVLRARNRKVRVRVLLDRAMETTKSSLLPDLLAAGMTSDEVRIDDKHAIFHDKVAIRDGEVARLAAYENGSFNYSNNAENNNAENAQVVEGYPDVAAAYLGDMERHWSHSRPVKVK